MVLSHTIPLGVIRVSHSSANLDSQYFLLLVYTCNSHVLVIFFASHCVCVCVVCVCVVYACVCVCVLCVCVCVCVCCVYVCCVCHVCVLCVCACVRVHS